MNTVTRKSEPNEGIAFKIPQLNAGAQPDCVPASVVRAAGADAAPRPSLVSALSRSLDAFEAQLAQTEARARRAEELLALHERHCICRAGKVAEAVAHEMVCEALDATEASRDSTSADEAGPSAPSHPSGTATVTR